MSAWGELMRRWNRRDTAARDHDLSVNYIGYYTDHGEGYWQWHNIDSIGDIFVHIDVYDNISDK